MRMTEPGKYPISGLQEISNCTVRKPYLMLIQIYSDYL